MKLIKNEGEPQQFRSRERPNVAPDLEGSYNIIGQLTYNSQTYAVLDAPHNGSCFYHSFSSMIRELKGGETPSARAFKKQLTEYYRHSNTTIKRYLELLLGDWQNMPLNMIPSPSVDIKSLLTYMRICIHICMHVCVCKYDYWIIS